MLRMDGGVGCCEVMGVLMRGWLLHEQEVLMQSLVRVSKQEVRGPIEGPQPGLVKINPAGGSVRPIRAQAALSGMLTPWVTSRTSPGPKQTGGGTTLPGNIFYLPMLSHHIGFKALIG